MNREQKKSRAHFLRRGVNAAAIVLVAWVASSPFAHAASFRCPHNASASERLVCSDPTLSALDDKLAALYRNAFNTVADADALNADRVSQWQWRQHNCQEKECVTAWYNRRIAELEGDLKHGKETTVQRVKEGVVDQQLAPPAQDAVLEMNGIEPAQTGQKAAPASPADNAKDATKAGANAESTRENTTLKLQKMQSGVTADERQKRLTEAYAHHLPAGDAAASARTDTSAMAAKMANASAALALAVGMAPLDSPVGQSAKNTGNGTASTTENNPANSASETMQDRAATQRSVQASAKSGANTITCSSVASQEPVRAAEASSESGAVVVK
ncbi:lysozyme inhibitor LprI family protein [Paraburkholderia adhaesiva]|uniref:lysozyme inhibitor LprI family protein n=1 Tax=Paraburkholderia adhaesiva TaxID=2883244 RepID=UPI001F15E07F|nr:hypothetical protein [Paraburkholderia adhaesiva]